MHHLSFLFLFLCILLNHSFLSLFFFFFLLQHIHSIAVSQHNVHIKSLWLCSMAAASSEGSVNLWLASLNRQFLIFYAFYCKKVMFFCLMWDMSHFQSLWPVPPLSWERMLLLVITQRVEFGPCCGRLRTSSIVEVSRFWITEL